MGESREDKEDRDGSGRWMVGVLLMGALGGVMWVNSGPKASAGLQGDHDHSHSGVKRKCCEKVSFLNGRHSPF